MSRTFSLVCRDTKQRLWIGQGYEEMNRFYSTDEHLGKLHRFLNATRGKPIVLLCNDNEFDIDVYDYEEFEEEADSDA